MTLPRTRQDLAHVARAAALFVVTGALCAGCGLSSGWKTGPADVSLPPTTAIQPNASSTSGPCGLLTADDVQTAVGVSVARVSDFETGCVWQHDPQGGSPVLDLQTITSQDGNIASIFDGYQKRFADPKAGDPGIGDHSFFGRLGQGEVYWLQNAHIYDLRVVAPPNGRDMRSVAVQLAQLASSRIP